MNKIQSAVLWDRGDMERGSVTVTLQEVCVWGNALLLSMVCQGRGDEEEPQKAAGYLCECMVGRFYNEIIPLCSRANEDASKKLERKIKEYFEKAEEELRYHERMKKQKTELWVSGILLWRQEFFAFGNGGCYVLNRRFNKPRLKKILRGGEMEFTGGEIRGLIRVLLDNGALTEALGEREIVECLFAQEPLGEMRLKKHLAELGREAGQRISAPLGAVVLEVEGC